MLELRQTARLVVFLSLVGGLLGYPTYRWEATVNIDPKNTHPVSDKLYGLFFEGNFDGFAKSANYTPTRHP